MVSSKAQPHQSPIYYEFSHLYDRTFGRVFTGRIVRVVGSLGIEPGASVLEIGVGTGISLEAYPAHARVTGIDLAEDMLAKARERITANGWDNIDVQQGDALNLPFPDASFDYVTAFHVVSVVPDARRMLAEACRVCRPQGTIAIVNHFRSEHSSVARVQKTVDPVFRRLGWTTLRLSELLRDSGLRVERQWKTSPRSLFKIVIARNEGVDHLGPDVAAGDVTRSATA
jgi:phosphatidylethanolamine/phosphatidyl-N-methylethanolamine N-methyltransferase